MSNPRFELTGVVNTVRISPGKFGKVEINFLLLIVNEILGIFLPGLNGRER